MRMQDVDDAPKGDETEEVPSYKKGTKRVPKTGMAKLHEGEEVVPAEKNPNNFTRDQIAEDTDRVMRGFPKKHGAPIPGEEEDMSGMAPEGEAAEKPEGEPNPDEYAEEEKEEGDQYQKLCEDIQSLSGKVDKILAHLGLNENEGEAENPHEDMSEGFGG